ncbi:MAG: hypothetical protein HZB82_05050 [Deltaproteobacteria bacterium]|nr:hypothetical protein [Deltaproteobacteria bacterium]
MKKTGTVAVVLLSFMLLLSSFAATADAAPHVQFPPSDAIEASKESVKELETFYAKVEEALIKKDVNALMAFYANDYFHNGMTKDIIKALWTNIFKNFDNLNSIHVFSSVLVQENEAVVACTGTLLGIPKDSKDKQYVAVDRWINQSHWLSKRGGSWQIVGGATHWLTETKVRTGRPVEYQLEFHPLF